MITDILMIRLLPLQPLCIKYRGQGIGSSLIKEMLSLLQAHGYKRVSLSVQKANYAAKLYQKIGFRIIKEIGDEWIMTYNL